MIIPITNSIGMSNPATIKSIDAIKNNGMITGQNNQNNACSQGFHFGLSVNSSVTLYPNMVYTMPTHMHTNTNNINPNIVIIPPLLFVKQAYRRTDLGTTP